MGVAHCDLYQIPHFHNLWGVGLDGHIEFGESGMNKFKKLLDKLRWKLRATLCWLFGHHYVVIPTGGRRSYGNGDSSWGWFYCPRCKHEERYQFDG